MRNLAWLVMVVGALCVGCDTAPVESEPTVTATSGDEAAADHDHGDHDGAAHDHADQGAADQDDQTGGATPEKVRFVADKKISVPEMMCPFGCWPQVQKALAAQPGVEDVQLAEQPEGTPEGEIRERVVELKLNDDFDSEAAIAALRDIHFEAEVIN